MEPATRLGTSSGPWREGSQVLCLGQEQGPEPLTSVGRGRVRFQRLTKLPVPLPKALGGACEKNEPPDDMVVGDGRDDQGYQALTFSLTAQWVSETDRDPFAWKSPAMAAAVVHRQAGRWPCSHGEGPGGVPETFKGFQFLLPSVIPEGLLPVTLMTSLSPSQESATAHHHARWGLLEGLLQDAGWARVLGREYWDRGRWPS